MPYKDKDKKRLHDRAYYKRYYLENKTELIKKTGRKNQSLKRRNRAWLEEYKKDKSCNRCGERHPACLQFHHISKIDKVDDVSNMANGAGSIEAIKQEIAKCVILCANCHCKLHYEERKTNDQVGE